MGVRDILSIGGEEDVESPGFTRVLGVDRNHQCRCVESTVSALQKISSKDDREPRICSTTRDAFHPCGGTATSVKRPKCTPHACHPQHDLLP